MKVAGGQVLFAKAAVVPQNSIVRKSERINNNLTPYQLVEGLRKQIQVKDEELEKAEQLNKSFEKLAQLISLLGQIDSFLTEKTKSLIKKIAVMADDNEKETADDREITGTIFTDHKR
nr:unnamed protein product [Callosobruchus analis]